MPKCTSTVGGFSDQSYHVLSESPRKTFVSSSATLDWLCFYGIKIELHRRPKPRIVSWVAAVVLLRPFLSLRQRWRLWQWRRRRLHRPYPILSRRSIQSRRLSRRPELAVERLLGPSLLANTECPQTPSPHKIQTYAVRQKLHHRHLNLQSCHPPITIGLGPRCDPHLKGVVVPMLDPCQVRVIDLISSYESQ